MAKDDDKREQNAAAQLRAILRGYGLNPQLFDDIIHQAVQNQWTPEEFIGRIYGSREFAAAFPGIFNPDGSLKMAPSQYLQLAYGPGGYMDIARNYGVKLNLQKIGKLVENNVSPDEWNQRARVLQLARESDAYRREFNRVLQARGMKPLEPKDWFNLIARRSESFVEDLYEAVSLRTAGLEVTPTEAVRAARQIGEPAQPVDLEQIVAQVRQVKDEIAPELRAAGITDADLAVLASGSDPRGIAPRLEQLLRNRRRLTQAGARQGGVRFAPASEGL